MTVTSPPGLDEVRNVYNGAEGDLWELIMVDKQLTYDALRILDYDMDVLQNVGAGMELLRDLAHAGKLIQGRFIAKKG